MAIAVKRGFGGGGANQIKNIFANGKLASGLTLSGLITISNDTMIVDRPNSSGNGGIINGIDFTNISHLFVDCKNNGAYGSVGQLEIYIDETLYQRTASDTTRRIHTINVSAVTGVHTLKLLIYSSFDKANIYSITINTMPKFNDNEIIKNGILNPKYTITGGSFAPDNLYVPYGGNGSGGALINDFDLTDYTGFNIEYQNHHATYRLHLSIDSAGSWASTAVTTRESTDSGNILGSYTGNHSLRFYTYGSSSEYSRIYNLTLY